MKQHNNIPAARKQPACIDYMEQQLAHAKRSRTTDTNTNENCHNQRRRRNNESNISNICTRLGDQYVRLDQIGKAEAVYAEAHSIRLSIDGPDHLRVARPLHGLALCWMKKETTKGLHQAHYSLEEALRIRLHASERCAAVDLATTYHDLGVVLSKLGQHSKAMKSFQEALSIRIDSLGEENTLVAETMIEIGKIYVTHGDLVRARSYLEGALSIRVRHYQQQQKQRQRQDVLDPVFSSEHAAAAAA